VTTSDPTDTLRAQAQALADAAIPNSPRLASLTDQAVADTLIRHYFLSLPQPSPSRHLVDVGAAYGSIAQVFLRDGWTADLFEPDPACHPILNRLLAAYPGRCRLFPFAVSDQDRDSVPFQQNSTPGLSGLAPSPFGATVATIPVRSVRLGDFLLAHKLHRLDFLKIDTEGTDFDVLESHAFRLLPPALVFVEYNFYFPSQSPGLLGPAIASMAGRGFAPLIFDYDDDGNFRRGNWAHRLVAVHLLPARLPDRPNSFGNILFYRHDDAHLLQVFISLLKTLA
jgi:FkbM family methyltransferase